MTVELDDARIADAFARTFADEPHARPAWDEVRARAAAIGRPTRRVRRRWLLVAVVACMLLVPGALLANRVWQLTVGAPAPAPIDRALLRLGQPVLGRDVRQTRVVGRVATSRGALYLLESPAPDIRSSRGAVRVICLSLLYGFPIEEKHLTRIRVAGHPLWIDRNATCGGVAPPNAPAISGTGGWTVVDRRLAAGYGHLPRRGLTIEATHADGNRTRLPTWHGYYLAATADAGRPNDRVVALTVRDRYGRVVARPDVEELAHP